MTLTKITDLAPQATISKREAGGDNLVPRDGKERPFIVVKCWLCTEGKVPSKKTGKPTKCQGCARPPEGLDPLPPGWRYKAYTRTTTYIDVIEDKSNLDKWGDRMVLIGVALKPDLLNDVLVLNESRDEKESKDALNRKAQVARQTAGAEDKADKGTYLHGLSELVDEDKPLPVELSFDDVLDMDAYKQATTPFRIVHMEKLVVHDELQVAGTPDRVSRWTGDYDLVAPDGTVIDPEELLITDLKTGSVEYGGLKMAMQLSLYSRSRLYEHTTGMRHDLGPVNQKWGIIMHLPAGSGECTLYWADLSLGWEAVEIAQKVRSLRSRSGKALSVLAHAEAA